MRKAYTTEFKIKIARMAIEYKKSGGGYTDVSEMSGIHLSVINRWVKEYNEGKLVEQKETKEESVDNVKVLRSIDRSLKQILKILKAEPQVPGTLVDMVAKEMNGD